MEKLLIQSMGSIKDPSFGGQQIWIDPENENHIFFHDFFRKQGIKTLDEDLIISCHGNTKLNLEIIEQIAKLAEEHKVVLLQQGGLYFAKPALEAANIPTVPVISIPLNGGSYKGLDAFLAPQVPSGTAAIAGTGVGRYRLASVFAAQILLNEFEGVYTFNSNEKLEDTLKELNVPILGDMYSAPEDSLVVCRVDLKSKSPTDFDLYSGIKVFTPINEPDPKAAIDLMYLCSGIDNSVYARGEENVAFFAAKIMASYSPDIKQALIDASKKKADSYEKRTITLESFGG